jgi:hypothetical protein
VHGLFPSATLRLSSITSIAAREARIKSPDDNDDDGNGDVHDINAFLMIKVVTMMMIITISL